jgi:hypothetical protein
LPVHKLRPKRVHKTDPSPELFRRRYARSGRPLLVRNATNWWPAADTFTFEFFRDVYEGLDR